MTTVAALLAKARAPSGQFARNGSRAHYANHIAAYRDQKAAGTIAGTRDEYAAHQAAWTAEKINERHRLLKELRHCEADQRAGVTGLEKRIRELRAKLKMGDSLTRARGRDEQGCVE